MTACTHVRDGRWRFAAAVFALACVGLVMAGCGGSSNDDSPQDPLYAAASPAGGEFEEGDTQMVTLTAMGEGSAGAVIYFTTDVTKPIIEGSPYTGPIEIDEDTVLRYAPVNTDEETAITIIGDEQSDSYQFMPTSGISEQWAMSGHGHMSAEAWRHWDGTDSVESRGNLDCARCHTGGGMADYAADGVVDTTHEPELYLDCGGCHDVVWGTPPASGEAAVLDWPALNPVSFPAFDIVDSGAGPEKVHLTASLFGPSNLCITCHQGRSSTDNVNEQIAAGAAPYTFANVHYYAAAASLFGSEVRGGYQYEAREYQARNTFPSHDNDLSTCVGCHMPSGSHTFEPDIGECTECHTGTEFSNLSGSPAAHYTAVTTLTDELWMSIEDYCADVLGVPIVKSAGYPYFFTEEGESYPFDAKSLRATYNYQFSTKEPCGYIHNGVYLQQILWDSIDDLGQNDPTIDVPGRGDFDVDAASKTAQFHLSGHDDAASEAFRHWDAAPPWDFHPPGEVGEDCARCHNADGYAEYVGEEPMLPVMEIGHLALSTVGCTACHAQEDLYDSADTRYDRLMENPGLEDVVFPSEITASFDTDANVCLACHQGRKSMFDVDSYIASLPSGYVGFEFAAVNPHYLGAGATLFGGDVKGGYEYTSGYPGRNMFPGAHSGLNDCTECHMREGAADHTFEPDFDRCTVCHGQGSPTDFHELSGSPIANYETIRSLEEDLWIAIEGYASGVLIQPIIYDGHSYPYFFQDNGAGGLEPYEFDAELLKATYNWKFSKSEPAGYIHNSAYVERLLTDALGAISPR